MTRSYKGARLKLMWIETPHQAELTTAFALVGPYRRIERRASGRFAPMDGGDLTAVWSEGWACRRDC